MCREFIVGRPFTEVQTIFKRENIRYLIEITRPVRDFFKIDEKNLYVVREKKLDDGKILLTLAAKQVRREVKEG